MDMTQNFWKKCSSCKKPISLNSKYYECSVSTCTGDRTGYVFCSIPCFEVHLPGARHRSAGAVEKTAPAIASAGAEAPKKILVQSSAMSNSVTSPQTKKSSMENEVLVVVSKMKQYIKDVSEMNTSEDVNQVISQMIRNHLDRAIEQARREGRKTVMARDFKS
jgi:histone H3/H4